MIETKTVLLKDDAHIKLCRIQLDLRELGIKENIQNICDISIRYGIDKAFEVIKKDKIVIDDNEKSKEKIH